MPYGTLKADIQSFVQRDDVTGVIPTWIRYATAQFSRVLRVPQMETRDVRTLTTEYASLPTDFLEVIAITRDDGRELRYIARPQFEAYASQDYEPDLPLYTVEDYQFRFLPAPSVASPLTVTILTYERVADFTTDASSNWLLDEHPDVYLWGTLLFARAWLHDDDRLARIKPLYDEQLAALARKKVHATGIASAVGTDIPYSSNQYNITRG
jgi:hypothetical protein